MLQDRYKDPQDPEKVSPPDPHIPIADIVCAQGHSSCDCLGFCHLICVTERFSEARNSQIRVFQANHFCLWARVFHESTVVAARTGQKRVQKMGGLHRGTDHSLKEEFGCRWEQHLGCVRGENV